MLPRKHVIEKHNKNDPGLALFDQFINAGTCKSVLGTFHQLCDILGLKTADHRQFYPRLKGQISSWKAQSIWTKLDKRASHKEYRRGEACKNTRVLVIGAGPCGLRVAIEAAFLGAKVVIVEKRDRFSRNNVLHLWPYVITDLRNLGAKKFFGKFCAGAIDHISIRQLQCILMKVALLVGVEIHTNTSFEGLIEPPSPDEQTKERVGWKAKILPENSPVSEFEFDVLIGADGKRNTLTGFRRKEFRGKLAIAITANFINHNTQAEASVEEISGVAFIFNQKFFLDLREQTGIDLENIVYYKDDTHYFVMTAKKKSLLEKGVMLNDYNDTIQLLSKENVNQEALLSYAREAADFSTDYQMPHLECAINHYGQPDVAMFDFTSMFAAHNASRIMERNGHKLLVALVGDSLLEPFWPTGTGCARGFLGALDAAWMIKGFASGKMTPLEVIAERESIFLLLSQTTPENIHKNFHGYTIDPNTRYPNLNSKFIKPEQVRHLCDSGDGSSTDQVVELPAKRARNDYIDSYTLLRWCQNLLNTGKYYSIHVTDFTTSWKSGLALCALIHIFKPDLIDFNSLSVGNVADNNQLVFDTALRELGVQPVMSGEDMANCDVPDKLTMVSYLSQLYEVLKKEPPPIPDIPKILPLDEGPKPVKPQFKKASLLHRLSNRFSKAKKRKDKEDIPDYSTPSFGSKRQREEKENDVSLTGYNKLPMDELRNKLTLGNKLDEAIKRPNNNDLQGNVNVRQMGELLVSKFRGYEFETPESTKRMNGRAIQPLAAAQPASEFCVFCEKRVYLMERMSAEGLFFHRGCLKCAYCAVSLRLGNYSFEKSPSGEPLFYCFRHFGMMMTRTRRKRNLDDKELGTEQSNDETGPPTKMSPPDPDKCSTPKKIPAPLQLPEETFSKALRTPERVEFENSLEGEEETEEEQTEHNLRASQSCDQLIEDEDDESDSDDDFTQMELAHILSQWSSGDEELEDEVMEDDKTETRKLVATWQKRHSQENLLDIDNDDELWSDDEDGSDEGSEYESEEEDEGSLTETESRNGDPAKESGDSDSNANFKSSKPSVSPAKTPTSPAAVKAARENFFSCAPEVVRLDPYSMFGMGKKPENGDSKAELTEDGDKNKDVGIGAEMEITPKLARRTKRHKKKEYEELEEEDESDSLSEDRPKRGSDGTEEDAGYGDDETEEGDEGEEGEEEDGFDKNAVSKAMEQLLQDLDEHRDSENSGEEKAGDSEPDEDVFDNIHGLKQHKKTESWDGDRGESEKTETEEVVLRVKSEESKSRTNEDEGSDTERAVLRSVMEMSDTETLPLGTGEDTLKALMDSLEAMNNEDGTLEKPEKSPDHVPKNIDDRFVTTRGRRKKKRSRVRKSINSESSLTGSSQSSFSSLSAEGYNEEDMDDEDDEKPDEELLRDYQLTLSQALGEDEPGDLQTISDNQKNGDLDADNTLTDAADIETDLMEDEGSMTSSMNSTMDNSAVEDMELDTSKNSPGKRERKKKSKSNIVRKFQSRQKIKGEKSLRTDTGKCLNSSTEEPLTLDVTEEIFYTPAADIQNSGPPAPSGEGPVRKLPDLPPVSLADKKHLVPTPKPSASSPQRRQDKSKAKSSPSNKKTDIPATHSAQKGKTRIAVDRSKLDSDPSSPKLPVETSYPAELGRKKIPLDSSLRAEQMADEVRKSIGDSIEDIPFADDSGGEMSPTEDVFFTPQTSIKPRVHPGKAERVPVGKAGPDIRKRLLPTPRKVSTPGVLPPDKIKEIKLTEMEKAKEQARERARLKSDEELGLRNMNYSHNAPVKLRGLHVGVISESDTDRSEFSRDSDDTRSPMSPLSPGSESGDAASPSAKKDKNKRKSKSTDSKSSQDEQKSDSSSARKDKEKRKSLLSMLLPSKTPDKAKDNGSVHLNGASKTPKSKTPKTPDKHKKTPKSAKKEKKKRRRTESKENLDTDLSENLRDLKIGTVWYDKLGSDGNERERAFLAARANVAPTAEVEDMYDSDESWISTGTLRSISRHLSRHQIVDEEMSEKVSKKVQHAARRQQKQREQKRLRMAQEIQRRLEEVDVKQRELEDRGITVEQSIRGTGAEPQTGLQPTNDLMSEWFNLVHEKNALVRYESELMVHARELELEDRQSRLEQKLRDRMAVKDEQKTEDDIAEEQKILNELLIAVEERDRLVAELEEDRLREQEEDKDLESIMLKKGFMLSPLGHTEKLKALDISSSSTDSSFV